MTRRSIFRPSARANGEMPAADASISSAARRLYPRFRRAYRAEAFNREVAEARQREGSRADFRARRRRSEAAWRAASVQLVGHGLVLFQGRQRLGRPLLELRGPLLRLLPIAGKRHQIPDQEGDTDQLTPATDGVDLLAFMGLLPAPQREGLGVNPLPRRQRSPGDQRPEGVQRPQLVHE